MPRHRIYESDADRQRAYRQRKALPGIYGLAEREATVTAAWALCDAIHEAAQRGDTEAAQLNGLSPSRVIQALTQRFLAR
jgi:hypothetical protein